MYKFIKTKNYIYLYFCFLHFAFQFPTVQHLSATSNTIAYL